MNTIKQRLFTNWHFARVLRLALGLFMVFWAIQAHDWSLGAISGLFVFMALSNTACCGAQGCKI
ncbi:hypothetical protein [Mucilaginibacter flavidus]|uniref:hypothetical protein n=1 Tax=Mucilaginibacter flavidus TaxID=2949309 RepID=UPI0020928044|nr:hypothetical protein [Mucilaginibacter flavidus]MCO5948888.1 hypothetical protein [Mucilaginibacter flavidus]